MLLRRLGTLAKTYIKKISNLPNIRCLQADNVELPCQIRMKASNITEDEVSNTCRMPAWKDKWISGYTLFTHCGKTLTWILYPTICFPPDANYFTSTKSLQVHLLLVIHHTLDSLRDDFPCSRCAASTLGPSSSPVFPLHRPSLRSIPTSIFFNFFKTNHNKVS